MRFEFHIYIYIYYTFSLFKISPRLGLILCRTLESSMAPICEHDGRHQETKPNPTLFIYLFMLLNIFFNLDIILVSICFFFSSILTLVLSKCLFLYAFNFCLWSLYFENVYFGPYTSTLVYFGHWTFKNDHFNPLKIK